MKTEAYKLFYWRKSRGM